MKKEDLKWPAVVIIVALIVVLGWLSYYGKDASTVLAGIIAVLGALGYGMLTNKQSDIQTQQSEIKSNTETIKDQTNGRITQLMEMLDKRDRDHQTQADQHRRDMKEMADKMALMTPPPPEPGGGTRSPDL